MATINQSPSGQISVAISGISFASITATSTPFWKSIKTVAGGSFAVSIGSAPSITMPAGLLGSVATVSSSTAAGVFTLNEQSAAKRLGAWPAPPA